MVADRLPQRRTVRGTDFRGYADLADSITTEPGLLWKVWTENATEQTADGIYLFADEASAQAYAAMHTTSSEGFGVTGNRAQYFDVNEPTR